MLRPGGTGHEVLGEVVDLVEPSTRARGQRVLTFTTGYIRMVPAAKKAYTRRAGISPDLMPLAGAFCQYILSFETATVPVPAAVPNPRFDPLWYVVAQPIGTIIRAAEKLGSVWGKAIAILGQGQNGLLMTQLVAKMGARHVICLDRLPSRLAVSKAMGATHTLAVADGVDSVAEVLGLVAADEADDYDGAPGVDVAIDMVGHQGHSLDMCSDMVKRDGTVLVFGLPPNTTDGDRGDSHSDMLIRYKNLTKNVSADTCSICACC